MWADPYDLAGLGDTTYGPQTVEQWTASIQSMPGQVAVAPTTQDQAFNLANTVAKGLLDVYLTQEKTKLSTAQIAAAAEASKVQAQNYVMQQLQQGKQVMVPESWLQKYAASDSLTKWLTPILIAGGVGLLGYAAYRYTQKKPVSANPLRRKKHNPEKRLSISDIEQWIDNDEGMYRWWMRSRMNKRRFIRENRSELESAINKVLGGDKPAHFLKYGPR